MQPCLCNSGLVILFCLLCVLIPNTKPLENHAICLIPSLLLAEKGASPQLSLYNSWFVCTINTCIVKFIIKVKHCNNAYCVVYTNESTNAYPPCFSNSFAAFSPTVSALDISAVKEMVMDADPSVLVMFPLK